MDPLLLNDWHPVAFSEQVAAEGSGTPMLATDLLETRVLLWRDSGGVLHAWEDRCPYHGWTFGKQGRCTRIPALPDAPLKAQVVRPASAARLPGHHLPARPADSGKPAPGAAAATAGRRSVGAMRPHVAGLPRIP